MQSYRIIHEQSRAIAALASSFVEFVMSFLTKNSWKIWFTNLAYREGTKLLDKLGIIESIY